MARNRKDKVTYLMAIGGTITEDEAIAQAHVLE